MRWMLRTTLLRVLFLNCLSNSGGGFAVFTHHEIPHSVSAGAVTAEWLLLATEEFNSIESQQEISKVGYVAGMQANHTEQRRSRAFINQSELSPGAGWDTTKCYLMKKMVQIFQTCKRRHGHHVLQGGLIPLEVATPALLLQLLLNMLLLLSTAAARLRCVVCLLLSLLLKK